jgi:hypothetical protein
MQEGIQLPELLAQIKALREAGLRAEHVAFSFMKRRVQPLMARDTLGFEYTGDDDTSRMPGDEVDDDDIVDRLSRIFKDMPPYTACPVPEYSAARLPKKVSSRTPVEYPFRVSSRADELCLAGCLEEVRLRAAAAPLESRDPKGGEDQGQGAAGSRRRRQHSCRGGHVRRRRRRGDATGPLPTAVEVQPTWPTSRSPRVGSTG